jgi:NADH-quinone oxidoreductase subunit N
MWSSAFYFTDFRFYLSLLPEKLLVILICFAILNAFASKSEVKSGSLLSSYLNYFAFFFFFAAIYWMYYLHGTSGVHMFKNISSELTFFFFYETIKINKLIIYIKIVISLLVGFSLYAAKRNLLMNNLINYEYPIVVSLATLGMFGSIMANNWIIFFLSLELQALCFLVLFAWNRRNLKAITASLKFSVVNFIASLFILLAIVEIILYTGSFNMSSANPFYHLHQLNVFKLNMADSNVDLSNFAIFMDNALQNHAQLFQKSIFHSALNNSSFLKIPQTILAINSDILFWDFVSFLLIMGFAIKLGLAPFGLWLQDLYTSVSLPVLTFFSTAPKITYITILVSLYTNLFIVVNPENFLNIIYVLSIISIIIANFSMFSIRDNLLKLLAWSSIANMGLLLLLFSFNPLKSYVFMYIIYYTFGTLLLFVALQFIVIKDSLNKTRNILYFSDLTILRHHASYTGLGMIIIFSLLSAFGIPPLMGFWVKFAAINAIVSNLNHMSFLNWGIVTVILLITLIGGYNYVRIIYTMLSETNNPHLNISYLPGTKTDTTEGMRWFVIFQVLAFLYYAEIATVFTPVAFLNAVKFVSIF